ncbi:MAG: hypothetical protein IJ455_00635 [Agathobacter sp.]|nr:hypothetical protein [Agathobacter sp.]
MNKNYTISVLLTKQEDWISKIIYYITGRGFTHASIGFDENDEVFYSFNIKGFRRELPKKHKDAITQSLCFKLNVSQEEYEKVVDLIYEFQEKRKSWKYSTMGVVLCLLRIPHKRKWHYFCSQFVAEILEKANIAEVSKHASLCLPNNLVDILNSRRAMDAVVLNPI